MKNTPEVRARIQAEVESILHGLLDDGLLRPKVEVTVDPLDPTKMNVKVINPPMRIESPVHPVCSYWNHPMFGKALGLCEEPECIVREVLER